jgi:alpha-L-fucosidase 2
MKTLAWLPLCLVAGHLAAGAELKKDIEYGRADGTSLLLDASTPEGPGPFPVAILVHGGGWSIGDKGGSNQPGNSADISPWFATLTAAKFTWFSLNYRLAPAHPWPAMLEDVRTAIRWVKAHAADYRGDPRRIVLFGHSSGGHLAAEAALRAGDDTRVQAFVGFAPVTDLVQDSVSRGFIGAGLQGLFHIPRDLTDSSRALLAAASPINHVTAAAPPVLLVHGDADKSVPYAQSLAFKARLDAAGVPCRLITVAGAPHSFFAWEKLGDTAYKAEMIAWINATLGPPRPPAP